MGADGTTLVLLSPAFEKRENRDGFWRSGFDSAYLCTFGFKRVTLNAPAAQISDENIHDVVCPENLDQTSKPIRGPEPVAHVPEGLRTSLGWLHSEPENIDQRSSVEGSVFLITQGGDVKPARLVPVGLFPGDGKEIAGPLSAFAEALSSARDEAQRSGYSARVELVEIQCLKSLVKFEEGFRPETTFTGKTDELGNFEFKNVSTGPYTIIVLGHGGLNAAIWISSITVERSKTLSIKLNTPSISCFDPKHLIF